MDEVEHFIVCCHGLDSPLPVACNPMKNLALALEQEVLFRKNTFVLNSRTNAGMTFDGIRNMAGRLLREIEETMTKLQISTSPKQKIMFSCIGHSLGKERALAYSFLNSVVVGGLILRYCLKLMNDKDLFEHVFIPTSFITIATPHLGVRRAKNVMGSIQEIFGELIFGETQTLDELMLRDESHLLLQMSEEDFLVPLAKFAHRTLVSSISFDHQVTHSSSSVTLRNQYKTKHAIFRYLCSYVTNYPDRVAGFSNFSSDYDFVFSSSEMKEKDLEGLRKLIHPEHSSSFLHHPQRDHGWGDEEIDHEFPVTRTIVQNLQTLEWRRLDFEIHSMFAHDSIAGFEAVSVGCFKSKKSDFSVDCMTKILAMDHYTFKK